MMIHQIRDCVCYALLEHRDGYRFWSIWTKSKDQNTKAVFGSKSWFCWGKAVCSPVPLHQCFHLWGFISVMGRRCSSVKTPDQGALSLTIHWHHGTDFQRVGTAVFCRYWSGALSSFQGVQCGEWHVTQTSSQASVHLSLRSWTLLGKAQTQ